MKEYYFAACSETTNPRPAKARDAEIDSAIHTGHDVRAGQLRSAKRSVTEVPQHCFSSTNATGQVQPPGDCDILWLPWQRVRSALPPASSAWVPLEVGGKYTFRGRFRPPLNTELESYLARVTVVTSSLVSRSTP